MCKRVRFMRIVVFFDLPTKTPVQRRDYAHFRKYLIKNGYLMLQKSVYTRLAVDGRMVEMLIKNLSKNRPPAGLIQVLKVTEKQFAGMMNIVGEKEASDVVDTMERLVVI